MQTGRRGNSAAGWHLLRTPSLAYAVALRARPDLRFAVASGATATLLSLSLLPLVLVLVFAFRLVPLVGSTVTTAIGSALTGETVAASISTGLGGGVAAMGFSRSPNPIFFANADRRAVELGATMG